MNKVLPSAELSSLDDMSESDGKNDTADFFRLPREMRDRVYANLVQDIILSSGEDDTGFPCVQVYVENVAIPKLARLNKQFKDEYEKQIKSMQRLVFKDMAGNRDVAGDLLPQVPFTTFKSVSFDLLMFCGDDSCHENVCPAAVDLDLHKSFIEKVMTTLPNLAEINARLFIDWKEVGKPTWDRWGHGPILSQRMSRFTEIEGLSTLELYPFYWRKKYRDSTKIPEVYKTCKGLVASWTMEQGWTTF